jgi:DNA-binding beta-propeller fold protein YncE
MKNGLLAILGGAALVACSASPSDIDGASPVSLSPSPGDNANARPLAIDPGLPSPRVPADPPTLDPSVLYAIDITTIPTLMGPGSLYISNRTTGGVLIWDVATQKISGGFNTVGTSHVAVSPDRKSVYVATSQNGSVVKIDTATKSTVATMTLASTGGYLTVSPDNATVFMTSGHSLLRTTASLSGLVLAENIPNSNLPAGMAWSASGKKLFIADGLGSKVFVRDNVAPGPIGSLNLPTTTASNAVVQLATMPSKGLVFAPNMLADTLTAFDGQGAIYGNAESTIAAGDMPTYAAAHPSRPYLYVTSPKTDTLFVVKVDVINGAPHLSIASTIANICDGPNGVTFSRGEAKAFVACNGAVVTMNSTTDTVWLSRPGPIGQYEVVWAP